MAQQNDEIRLVQVTIYLGSNPNFIIRADDNIEMDDGRIRPPSRARYTQRGLGQENMEVLQGVLNSLKEAYRNLNDTMSLCLEGRRIVSKRRCQNPTTSQ